MVKIMNVNLMILILVVVTISATDAAIYTVGDDLGWTIPPGGSATYAAWAAKHSFVVNDILAFNFSAGENDLAIVTKGDYDACNTSDPLYEFRQATTLKFLGSDTYYFTSTLAGHCTKGQKITIYIAPSAASPSPSPTAAFPFKFVPLNMVPQKHN